MTYRRAYYNTWEEYIHKRYDDKIINECKNFVFLNDGSMVYDYDIFAEIIKVFNPLIFVNKKFMIH